MCENPEFLQESKKAGIIWRNLHRSDVMQHTIRGALFVATCTFDKEKNCPSFNVNSESGIQEIRKHICSIYPMFINDCFKLFICIDKDPYSLWEAPRLKVYAYENVITLACERHTADFEIARLVRISSEKCITLPSDSGSLFVAALRLMRW